MTGRFCAYELKTTDVEGAREFYSAVFGHGFWGDGIDVAALPPAVAARGVPPYWLGHIAVEDVVGTAYGFLEAGASRLGATSHDIDNAGVMLRDPFGARFALRALDGAHDHGTRAAWHLLSARDEEQGLAWYAGVFGWRALDRHDLAERGRHVTFTWETSDRPVGSASDIARQPHVHPQWLYFFPTDSLDRSLARVRELGGLALRPARMPEGHRVVACDDPQGGAFGLFERRGRA